MEHEWNLLHLTCSKIDITLRSRKACWTNVFTVIIAVKRPASWRWMAFISFFSLCSLETGTVLHKRLVGRDNEGIVMETLFQETGSTPVLVYGTDFGDIVAWDLRIQNEAYRLKNGPRNGSL